MSNPNQQQPQRPFFLSTFLSTFRPQPALQQNKPSTNSGSTTYHAHHRTGYASSIAAAAAAQQAAQAAAAAASSSSSSSSSQQQQQQRQGQQSRSIPINVPSSRRRGSNSSSEGFREATGAERYYIGGRTAAGEEKYFKLGVIKRVKSNDGLSLDRLSL